MSAGHHRVTDSIVVLDGGGQGGPVHAGHLIVEEREVVGIVGGSGLAQGLYYLLAGSQRSVAHAPTDNLLVKHAPAYLVVVDDEDSQVPQVGHGEIGRAHV